MGRKAPKAGDLMKWRKPQKRRAASGEVLLKDLLNPAHPLYRLAGVVNWAQFEQQFGKFYADEMGRPALATRLVMGLHYLKYLYNVSDEVVVASWVENPYWQYFCGAEYFAHEFPCDPTSLVKWRQRVGVEGSEQLLKESLAAAQREAVLTADGGEAGECGYDGAGEGDCVSDRCAVVSQGAASVGAAGAAL